MLVLSRKLGESVQVGDGIVIRIVGSPTQAVCESELKPLRRFAFSEKRIAGRAEDRGN